MTKPPTVGPIMRAVLKSVEFSATALPMSSRLSTMYETSE